MLRLYLEAGGPSGDKGAFASSADYDRRAPLHIAAAAGNLEAVTALLDAGADINAKDRWFATALDEATKNGHDACASSLKERGGTLGSPDGSTLAGTLCDAAQRRDLDLIRRLADAGANLSASEYDARTVAHLACAEGWVEAVEFLLSRGANLTARDRWKNTPYSEAKREKREDVVRMLEAAGMTE